MCLNNIYKKKRLLLMFIIIFVLSTIIFFFKASYIKLINYYIPWYEAGISREEFIKHKIIPALGQAPVLKETVTPLKKKLGDIHTYYYVNPLQEKVPVIILNNNQNISTQKVVIAIHETNKIGGEEPCGKNIKDEMAYGRALSEKGYIVVCPTLSFTGRRQPINYWDTKQFYENYPNWSALGKDIMEISWLLDSMAISGFDVSNVAVIGHSQGAIYGLFAAALDLRIKTVIANAGFVSFKYDPNPERWSRNKWYKALPKIPSEFTYAEVVAAIAPRNALICNYLQDEILVATYPYDHIKNMIEKYPSIDWLFFSEGHSFPIEVREFAFSWLSQTFISHTKNNHLTK